MNPLTRYPVLASLLKPFRRSQQKTCAAVVALCQAAQALSFAIAGRLACLTDVQLGSALTRLCRFLRNDRFDNWLLTEQMLRLLGRRSGPLLLALDWTCWHDRFSLLTASACAGTRSIPVAAAACTARNLSRSQNIFEETFLRPSQSSYIEVADTGEPDEEDAVHDIGGLIISSELIEEMASQRTV